MTSLDDEIAHLKSLLSDAFKKKCIKSNTYSSHCEGSTFNGGKCCECLWNEYVEKAIGVPFKSGKKSQRLVSGRALLQGENLDFK